MAVGTESTISLINNSSHFIATTWAQHLLKSSTRNNSLQLDCYWLDNFPFNNVILVGFITAISPTKDNKLRITLDDSTGLINCDCQLPPTQTTATPTHPLLKSTAPPDIGNFDPGDLVKVAGRLAQNHWGDRFISVDRIKLLSNPNEEIDHHLAVSKLHSTIYFPLKFNNPRFNLEATLEQIRDADYNHNLTLTQSQSQSQSFDGDDSMTTISSSAPSSPQKSTRHYQLPHPKLISPSSLTPSTFQSYLMQHLQHSKPVLKLHTLDSLQSSRTLTRVASLVVKERIRVNKMKRKRSIVKKDQEDERNEWNKATKGGIKVKWTSGSEVLLPAPSSSSIARSSGKRKKEEEEETDKSKLLVKNEVRKLFQTTLRGLLSEGSIVLYSPEQEIDEIIAASTSSSRERSSSLSFHSTHNSNFNSYQSKSSFSSSTRTPRIPGQAPWPLLDSPSSPHESNDDQEETPKKLFKKSHPSPSTLSTTKSTLTGTGREPPWELIESPDPDPTPRKSKPSFSSLPSPTIPYNPSPTLPTPTPSYTESWQTLSVSLLSPHLFKLLSKTPSATEESLTNLLSKDERWEMVAKKRGEFVGICLGELRDEGRVVRGVGGRWRVINRCSF